MSGLAAVSQRTCGSRPTRHSRWSWGRGQRRREWVTSGGGHLPPEARQRRNPPKEQRHTDAGTPASRISAIDPLHLGETAVSEPSGCHHFGVLQSINPRTARRAREHRPAGRGGEGRGAHAAPGPAREGKLYLARGSASTRPPEQRRHRNRPRTSQTSPPEQRRHRNRPRSGRCQPARTVGQNPPKDQPTPARPKSGAQEPPEDRHEQPCKRHPRHDTPPADGPGRPPPAGREPRPHHAPALPKVPGHPASRISAIDPLHLGETVVSEPSGCHHFGVLQSIKAQTAHGPPGERWCAAYAG